MDKGYIQLIDINTKRVLAQREGLKTPEFFEYHRHKVWVVKPEQAPLGRVTTCTEETNQ